MKAFVLIDTELGQEEQVVKLLKKIDEAVKVYIVYGIHDVIAVLEAESQDMLKDIIFNKIRVVEQVKKTNTLVTYGEPVINP
ncbi:Lrp/AsnC family transcriptional regulator [Candidatus Bathyarchaeota archaeon]|nr:Lrp/AsnC family transcriptional regulator [Candidatus Bathyarchaeota archaeon]